MKKKVIELFNVELKAINTEKFTLDAIFSSNKTDRHGDVVQQNFDLKNFKKNPVILNSHSYGDATEVIGKASRVSVKEGALQGTIEFAVKENPKAKIIFDLYAGGFLNAFSIGFIPLDMNAKGEISKSELLEVSAVSVPANAMALAKAKGINIEKLYEENNEVDEVEDNEANTEAETGDEDGSEEREEDNKTEESEEQIEGNNESENIDEEKEDEADSNDSEDRGTESDEEVEQTVEVKTLTVQEKKQLVLNKIVKSISILGELNSKVATPEKVRAKNMRLINKAIRNLIKEKKV